LKYRHDELDISKSDGCYLSNYSFDFSKFSKRIFLQKSILLMCHTFTFHDLWNFQISKNKHLKFLRCVLPITYTYGRCKDKLKIVNILPFVIGPKTTPYGTYFQILQNSLSSFLWSNLIFRKFLKIVDFWFFSWFHT